MKDSFEEFLEDAMSGPDFELGHEMRRRLLEAAVAGEGFERDNVVRMDRNDPEVQEGFNWLLGETEASEPLMTRMISDPAFFGALDGERRFVRTLRRVLMKQAEGAAPAAARRRFLPAVAVASAAAIALAAGMIFFGSGGSRVSPAVAHSDPAPRQPEAGAPVPAAASVAAAPAGKAVEVAVVESTEAAVEARPSAPSALIPASPVDREAPAIAALTGSGQSITPADPVLARDSGAALSLPAMAAMAEEASLQDTPFSLLDSGPDSEPSLAFHSDRGGMWDAGFISGLPGGGGLGISLIDNGRESTIPEPGPVLPVVIGVMALLLRRRRKVGAQGA